MTLANGKQVFNGSTVTVSYYGQKLTGVVEDMRNVYKENDLRFNLRFDRPTEVMGDIRNCTLITISDIRNQGEGIFLVDVAA